MSGADEKEGLRRRDPNTTNEYEGFFSSNYYADNLIHYFDERTGEDKVKPFFAYLPFSAPHWPLQCSKADRDKYKVGSSRVRGADRRGYAGGIRCGSHGSPYRPPRSAQARRSDGFQCRPAPDRGGRADRTVSP